VTKNYTVINGDLIKRKCIIEKFGHTYLLEKDKKVKSYFLQFKSRYKALESKQSKLHNLV